MTSVKAKLVEVENILENKENRMENILKVQNEAIETLITALNEKAVEIANLEKKVNKLSETKEIPRTSENFKEPNDEITNEGFSTFLVAPVSSSSTFPCELCDQKFFKESDLKKHKKTVHPVKHPCEVCWHMFETERAMKNHHRNVHQP